MHGLETTREGEKVRLIRRTQKDGGERRYERSRGCEVSPRQFKVSFVLRMTSSSIPTIEYIASSAPFHSINV